MKYHHRASRDRRRLFACKHTHLLLAGAGFKSARVDFADAFSQTLRGSTGANGTTSGIAAIQIGSGVTTSAIRNIYTQGGLVGTGVQTDLAISGEGLRNLTGSSRSSPASTVQFRYFVSW